MRIKILILLIILFVIENHGISQGINVKHATITFMNDSVVNGFIKYNKIRNNKCIFKINPKDDFDTLSPNNIKEFIINNEEKYSSICFFKNTQDSIRLFLQVLVEGEFNLYSLKDTYFVQEGNNPMISLINKDTIITKEIIYNLNIYDSSVPDGAHSSSTFIQKDYVHEDIAFVGKLKYIFRDCPEIQNRLTKFDYSKKEIIDMAKTYNKFLSPEDEFKSFEKGAMSKITYGLFFGEKYCGIYNYVDPEKISNWSPAIHSTFGLALNFGLKYNFSIQSELFYSKRTTSYIYPRASFVDAQVNMEVTHIEIPLDIYYSVPFYKFQPFIYSGFSYGHMIDSKSTIEIISTGRIENMYLMDYLLNLRIGAGVQMPTKWIYKLYIKYLFESGRIVLRENSKEIPLNPRANSILIGFMF